MLLFTSLSTDVHSPCAVALDALVRLLFSTVFLSLSLFATCGWCWQRSIPCAVSSSCQGPLHMCRARASCSVLTVLSCPSHRLLSALVAAGTCWKGWSGKLLVCPCFWAAQHCTLSVCCWRWCISRGEVLLLSGEGGGLMTRQHLSSLIPPSHPCPKLISWCPELAANAYVVDLVPRDVVWRYPCGLKDALVWEDAASYHQLVQVAQVFKALTIFIHLSQSMSPHKVLVTRVVHSDLGVEISHQYGYVLCFCLTLLVAVGRNHLSSLPPHHWWEHSTGWCSAWCLSSWW